MRELIDLYAEHKRALLETDFCGAIDKPVFGEGQKGAILMFIGEAPGAKETELSRPFVGTAGKQLDNLLAGVDIDRKSAFVTNAVKFRPTDPEGKRNRTPKVIEIEFSRELLMNEIEIIKPKYIATLGNIPLLAVTGNKAQKIGSVHGSVIIHEFFTLFPLFHPASIIYNRSLKEVYESDIKRLSDMLK